MEIMKFKIKIFTLHKKSRSVAVIIGCGLKELCMTRIPGSVKRDGKSSANVFFLINPMQHSLSQTS